MPVEAYFVLWSKMERRRKIIGDGQKKWAGYRRQGQDATESAQLNAVAIGKEKDLPKDLVLTNIVESNLADHLIGKSLVPKLVAAAKREEIIEVYRRGVWEERLPVSIPSQ